MKTSGFLLLLTLSFSALAQIEHSCREFDQKRDEADREVKNFDMELRKLDAKLRSIDERLASRTQTLNGLLVQRDRLNDDIRSITAEQPSLRVEISRLRGNYNSLNAEINQKEQQRVYHVNQANATSNLSIKREHLRQSKLLEKEIERLRPQLAQINQSINASEARLNNIDIQLRQKSQQIEAVNRQIEQEQRDPSIVRLQQERQLIDNELSNSQITLDNLNRRLFRAEEHVTMCYGYQELSVKYPAALRIAQKVNKKGCSRYVPVNQGSELENQAQDDVLNSLCR